MSSAEIRCASSLVLISSTSPAAALTLPALVVAICAVFMGTWPLPMDAVATDMGADGTMACWAIVTDMWAWGGLCDMVVAIVGVMLASWQPRLALCRVGSCLMGGGEGGT